MTGNTEDISYRMGLFKNSSGFKYAKVDIPEEKPKKPLKTKSKRVLSTNPNDNKTYRI
jgi:hypothetical protein